MIKIGIIGVGLIGGSMALKLKDQQLTNEVFGIDQNEEHLQTALKRGIIDKVSTLEEAIKEADLLILSIPVDGARKLLPSILDKIGNNTTVMDVGSTKFGITEAVKEHPNRKRYVAFHPMWGTENSGPESATSESFKGKAGVICNPEQSADDALQMVKKVAQNLEMHLIDMNAQDHDIHTAYISHISHITSYALANTVLEKEREEDTIFQLASSGFSSTVRLAKSHPEMWVPIFRQNKENVLDVLNEHISQLRKFKSALEKENYEYLEELIRNANKIRGILK